MQNDVRDNIIENRLLFKGDRCILAVSGGADSMGMMHALIRLNNVFHVNYRVVHVHHGLRGAEADRDADFVKSACERYSLPCKIIEVNVRDFASKHKLSVEEAGRYLRYQALETEARKWEMEEDTQKQVKVAIAHNREDNAETILMQLCRGSGLKGVSGMSPVRGRIIRPLLGVSRTEIEKYLIKEEESWINDSTNEESDYTRNRVRHDIMPLLVKEVNTGAVENITRAASLIGQADRYLTAQAEKLVNGNLVELNGSIGLFVDAFRGQDAIIRTYMTRLLIGKINKTMKNITARHVEEVAGLIDARTGKRVDLPYRLQAERDYDMIRLFRKDSAGDEGSLPFDPARFKFRAFPYKGEKAPEDKYVKWFDYDSIDDFMEVRTRKTGDYMDLKGVGRKAVRTYMTDVKIPAEKRDSIPLVAVGDHVMWLVGYRISEAFKVRESTEIVMEISYVEDTDNI